MQLPIKAHYATLAMLALAENYASRAVLPVRQIAVEQSIPSQFLTQILQQLRSAGLVSSTRGSSGGFFLERSPERVSVGDIVDAVCPANESLPAESNSPMNHVVSEVWQELQVQQRAVLARLTLAELLTRCRDTSGAMFYI
jgi:Rrf2 family protein